jgi:clan AA aspartic protease
MGLTHVKVKIRNLSSSDGAFEELFLVDSGATDSLVSAAVLHRIGMQPVGQMTYELADGTRQEYTFGLAEITILEEITAGRVIFAPADSEPILGVTALESAGFTIDPCSQTLKKLPAISLK